MNLIGLADGNGKLLGCVAIKKVTTTSLGKIWTAVTIHNPKLEKLALDFAMATRWRGPFELECITDGSEIFLIEINPRFPAWVYFATGVGLNLPQNLVRCALKQKPLPCETYAAGKLFVRYCGELVTDMEKLVALSAEQFNSHKL